MAPSEELEKAFADSNFPHRTVFGLESPTDEDVVLLFQRIAEGSDLASLYLGFGTIAERGLNEIAKNLELHSSKITKLSLCHNDLGDVGASRIAQALKVNSTLLELDLGSCNIGNTGAAAIGESLTVNKTLKILDLSKNHIDRHGATSLASYLINNATLTTLLLAGNTFNSPAYQSIALMASFRDMHTDYGLSEVESKLKKLLPLKHEWEELSKTHIPAPAQKVFFLGDHGSGKTTLAKSLETIANSLLGGRSLFHEEPGKDLVKLEDETKVVNLVSINQKNHVVMHILDTAGNPKFHRVYDYLLTKPRATFVVFCNLGHDTAAELELGNFETVPFHAEEQRHALHYWLNYVKHSHAVTPSFGDVEGATSPPRVLIVGTRGVGRDTEAAQLMASCLQEFPTLDIHPAMFCLDATRPRSKEVLEFYHELQQSAHTNVENLNVPKTYLSFRKHVSRDSEALNSNFMVMRLYTAKLYFAKTADVYKIAQLMDMLGEYIYFYEKPSLTGFVFVNPSAFGRLVYALLDPTVDFSKVKKEFDLFHQDSHWDEFLQCLDLANTTTDGDSPTQLVLWSELKPLKSMFMPEWEPSTLAEPQFILARRFLLAQKTHWMSHGYFPRLQVRLYRLSEGRAVFYSNAASLSIGESRVFMLFNHDEAVLDVAIRAVPHELPTLLEKLRAVILQDHMLCRATNEYVISGRATKEQKWPVGIPRDGQACANAYAVELKVIEDLMDRHDAAHYRWHDDTLESVADLLKGTPTV